MNAYIMNSNVVVGIEFANRQATKLLLLLWIELACIEVELVPGMEYRVESCETEYRLEFEEAVVTLYLAYQFGPKVFQRPIAADFRYPSTWELLEDYSDI